VLPPSAPAPGTHEPVPLNSTNVPAGWEASPASWNSAKGYWMPSQTPANTPATNTTVPGMNGPSSW
jgi:hypothetical protein